VEAVVALIQRDDRPTMPSRADPAPVKALARAFRYRSLPDEGRYASISEMAAAERIARGYLGRIVQLTVLAPGVVQVMSGLPVPRWPARLVRAPGAGHGSSARAWTPMGGSKLAANLLAAVQLAAVVTYWL
jgi:hypothetical protein